MIPSSRRLTDRVAVVTGASSGIGAATSRALAAAGARTALVARRADRLAELVAEIEADGGIAMAFPADVTDPAAVDELSQAIDTGLGGASILVNNAGVMLPAPFTDEDETTWRRQIDLNVQAMVSVAHAFTPQLLRSVARDGVADLINTGSIASEHATPNFAVYAGTKAFVAHFTRTLRAELGPQGLRVGEISPGVVDTELAEHVTYPPSLEWMAWARTHLDLLRPQDVADVVAFIVSRPAHVNLSSTVILPTKQV